MKNITVIELQQLLKNNSDIQLIDVREPFEHHQFNIGGQLIPINDVIKNIAAIDKNKMVILYCKKGIRSQIAIQKLQQKFAFTNLVNLIGGIEAWKKSTSLT
jgi:rhodanese-related sulfurtransferase